DVFSIRADGLVDGLPGPGFIGFPELYTAQFEPRDCLFRINLHCLLNRSLRVVPLLFFLLIPAFLKSLPCAIWSLRASGANRNALNLAEPVQGNPAQIRGL